MTLYYWILNSVPDNISQLIFARIQDDIIFGILIGIVYTLICKALKGRKQKKIL